MHAESMAVYLEYLQEEGFAKYEEARKLSEEESKKDPDNDPYKSKYRARDILLDIRKKLENYDSDSDEKDKELVVKLASLQYHLGCNYLDTEELSSGEEHMNKCQKLLEECKMDECCISLVICTLNQLGILWCARSEHEKAMEFLMEAKNLFEKYKHEVGGVPYGVHEALQVTKEDVSSSQREKDFEKIHTHTLYYLAQVYGQLKEPTKSASYCQTTLKRQLESSQYEPIDWSLNCATLSQYYITQDDFTHARHCLASSSRIFAEAKSNESPNGDDTSEDWTEVTTVEHIQHRKADIARCWAKYCLALLQYSKDNEEDGASGQAAAANTNTNDVEEGDQDVSKMTERFSTLELTSLENSVTDKVVTTFDQAREVFLAAQKWLNEAKEYYVLDGHVSDHIEITRDLSQLFKLLAHFEPDHGRKCQMHKRRVDMLKAELEELNPQHFLLVCRQLQYEIAETYSEMMDLKMHTAQNAGDEPTPHARKKINQLITQSIAFYQLFLDSLRNHEKKMPEKLDDDVLRPAMVAYFCMARLHSKYITPDLRMSLASMNKSLELYKMVVDYCTKHPDSIKKVEAEYEVCKEMVDLLPVRMERLRNTYGQ